MKNYCFFVFLFFTLASSSCSKKIYDDRYFEPCSSVDKKAKTGYALIILESNDSLCAAGAGVGMKDNFSEKISGQYFLFYSNGKPKCTYTLVNGMKNGEINWYYLNGEKLGTSIYKGGMLNGKSLTWYPNGVLKSLGEYKDNKQVGQWTYYNSNGTIYKIDSK